MYSSVYVGPGNLKDRFSHDAAQMIVFDAVQLADFNNVKLADTHILCKINIMFMDFLGPFGKEPVGFSDWEN